MYAFEITKIIFTSIRILSLFDVTGLSHWAWQPQYHNSK